MKKNKFLHIFRKWRFLIFICILIFSFSISIVYAHPGRTDENGGHYNRSTGEYHYHHGYPAHQHVNGTCPYDFDDKTGENSSTIGSHSTNTTHSNASITSKSSPPKQSWFSILFYLSFFNFVPSFFLYLIVIISMFILHAVPENEKIFLFRWHYLVCLPATLCYLLFNSQITGAVLLASVPIFCFFGYTLYYTLMERHHLENEKKKYVEMYEGKEPFDLCGAPSNAHIDENGLPHQIENNRDIFDVLITPNGKVFHCKFTCTKIYPHHVNYYNVKHLRPCTKCHPTIPKIEWYENYLKIKSIKEKYHIK